MRDHYHIIIFSIAIVCFCIGSFLYFNFKNTLKVELEPIDNRKPFKPITFTENLPEKSLWDEPKPQSTGEAWLFQVFTPPKIWIDQNGDFSAEAFVKPVPFGVSLASFEKKKYRYKFLSSLGKRDNPEIIILLDLKTGKELRVRQNRNYEEFRIISYKVIKKEVLDSQIDGKPLFDKIPTIEILDKPSGTLFNLSVGKDTYTNQYLIGLKPDRDSELLLVKSTGDKFKINDAEYQIEAINSTEKSIRILKNYRSPTGKNIEQFETLFLEENQTK